ncbi:hypothetical protein PR202_gb16163 [Eleusine coracana subsp. coracana]|uniref:Dirigent protein n=1 Tax=Eleusine coracana subsp. coracana TaxID=191504 RepID=A0AAV5F1G4_ELECO|nr:hypothetical protein PR202_gb16163 [Eleusine coracana subsp. coracana]
MAGSGHGSGSLVLVADPSSSSTMVALATPLAPVSNKHAMLLQIALLSLAALAGTGDGAKTKTRTHIRFYMHDLVTALPGRPATAVRITTGTTPVPVDPRIRFGDIFNTVFTAGPYNGSTIALVSRDAFFDEVRELPVVGGTGMFRGVSGYGLLRTHIFNTSEMNAVLKIDMYLRR